MNEAHTPDSWAQFYPPVETHLIRSNEIRQTFRIQVMQPPQPRGETRRFPVVYATDANASFDILKGIAWLLQAGERFWRPFILVGVGYPGESPVAGERLRLRDFTFPGCPDFVTGARWTSEEMTAPEEGSKSFGGGEAFADFIERRLIPWMDERYPTLMDHRTYFGHSLAGGFGLFTLLSRPELFNAYVVSSPVLSYHGRAPDGTHYEQEEFMFQRLREFACAGGRLEGIRLHLSVGSEEDLDPLILNWQFTSNYQRWVHLLRELAIPGLQWSSDVIAGAHHLSAWPIAFIKGMDRVFPR